MSLSPSSSVEGEPGREVAAQCSNNWLAFDSDSADTLISAFFPAVWNMGNDEFEEQGSRRSNFWPALDSSATSATSAVIFFPSLGDVHIDSTPDDDNSLGSVEHSILLIIVMSLSPSSSVEGEPGREVAAQCSNNWLAFDSDSADTLISAFFPAVWNMANVDDFDDGNLPDS